MTSSRPSAEAHDASPGQRLDKWLWHARVVKTRTLATKLVTAGQVRINRQKIARASHPVRLGDVLTIAIASRVRILRVLAFAARRGSAEDARKLWEDLTPPPVQAAPDPAGAPTPVARPQPRDRRAARRMKEGW